MNMAEGWRRYFDEREEERRRERMKKYHWAITMDRWTL